ncbi:carbohydrate-binding module family 1 protein [Sphaerobolus stellatus SS14]|uniref:Carbohydrate-binding module family 1 protein n=1 Tax=Sphaerobolus stellatus (strain SS14) TaxID=990650 RepID=A0A0C9W629_SPHS4|nr:carbohydrate-binding module family 1 protein [Sphaerobolus stellatus SS14]
MRSAFAVLALGAVSARAGSVLWSGFFNSSSSVADFDKWSWSNQIQPWQWYIHGSAATSEYIGMSSSFKNPADTTDAQGIKLTIDGTAFWNGQTMERTEIIPQTTANLGSGHLYYHFSLMTTAANAPNPGYEHQIAFFESHFTELKFGLLSGAQGTSDPTLKWCIGGTPQWNTTLSPSTWYNFAYDIDFSAKTVGLWMSTGSNPLVQTIAPRSASPSTNSADFHIGVLRLPNGGTSAAAEDFYWSGIYVEQAPITTSVAGPNPGSAPSGSAGPTTTVVPTTVPPTTAPVTTTTASGPKQTQWGQCAGNGYTGPTTCASPYKCVAVSPPYYSQCQ